MKITSVVGALAAFCQVAYSPEEGFEIGDYRNPLFPGALDNIIWIFSKFEERENAFVISHDSYAVQCEPERECYVPDTPRHRPSLYRVKEQDEGIYTIELAEPGEQRWACTLPDTDPKVRLEILEEPTTPKQELRLDRAQEDSE